MSLRPILIPDNYTETDVIEVPGYESMTVRYRPVTHSQWEEAERSFAKLEPKDFAKAQNEFLLGRIESCSAIEGKVTPEVLGRMARPVGSAMLNALFGVGPERKPEARMDKLESDLKN